MTSPVILLHKQAIALARRAARWYLHVDSPNLVRRALNQGLLAVLAGLLLLNIGVLPLALTRQELSVFGAPSLFSLPSILIACWFARRGTVSGALVLTGMSMLLISGVYEPRSYTNPPMVHLLFLFPALIASLFVWPWAGAVVVPLQAGLLTLSSLREQPLSAALAFFVVCSIDMMALMLPIAVVASMFRRTIVNLSALTAHLDSQVSARTAELQRQMALRESDVTAVVHDIQNRMTLVRAEIDDLIDVSAAHTPASELRGSEKRVNSAIAAVGHLIDDLRTAAQLDNAAVQLQRDAVYLEALARRVIDQFGVQAELSQCQLSLEIEPGPPVSGDEHKLERVLANLVGNAVKYVRQVPPEQRKVVVRVRALNNGSEITISDQGPGMDAQALERLGQPFTRLASARGTEGMGLGVYISKGIVELHGGRLSFSSPGVGQGTTVTIWLPAESDVPNLAG